MSVADRLRHARERTGLTGSQVRERTEIGESSLSDFENAKREPSLSQLRRLARVYRRPLSFFLSDDLIPEPAMVMWRERPEEFGEIEARFIQWCEQYHNLEIWTGEKAHFDLPAVTCSYDEFQYREAEDLARQVGRYLALGERPGRTLLTVLEEVCGVKIFHDAFEPTGTAACAKSESFGGGILLNSGNPRWRRNHDLAHELFHLLTWPIFHSAPASGVLQPSDQEERLATCFAANLLMPGDTFRSAIECRSDNGKIDYLDLYDVAREFDVSIESVIWRIHFVYNWGPAKSDETKTLIEKVKSYASQYEDRKEESEPDRFPDRYRALAVKALRRGEISVGKFAEYLEVTRQRALTYMGEEGADIEEIAYSSS